MARKAATKVQTEEVEEAPKKTERGTAWLTEYVNEECATSHSAATIRILLRKLVKEGVLAREVGEDRSRYTFAKGANDPIVKAVVKAVKSGAVKEQQKEKLDELKAKKAAAPKATAKKSTRRAKAKAEPEIDEDDILDDEDLEDIEDL